MEPPTKQSSNHHIILQVGIRITLTTPTFTAVNTHVVSMAAATNQPNFILEDYVDSKGGVPNTMALVLKMATPITLSCVNKREWVSMISCNNSLGNQAIL